MGPGNTSSVHVVSMTMSVPTSRPAITVQVPARVPGAQRLTVYAESSVAVVVANSSPHPSCTRQCTSVPGGTYMESAATENDAPAACGCTIRTRATSGSDVQAGIVLAATRSADTPAGGTCAAWSPRTLTTRMRST